MKYVKFTYVNQLYMPDFDGLRFDFALESEYPAVSPVFYGTCNSASGEGLIAVITKAEYEQDKDSEMASRKVKADKQSLAQIAAKRWQVETAGFELNGSQVSTDRTTVAMISSAALAAVIDPTYVARWKEADGFVTLTAEQIIDVAKAIRNHVQACFDRESDLTDAVLAGEYTEDMLEVGWP